MSNSSDPDQAGHFVRPDQGPKGKQRLPVNHTIKKTLVNKELE